MNCTIEILSEKRQQLEGFRYFWFKHVVSFNPEVHCADCLVGRYCDVVAADMPTGQERSFSAIEGNLFYLCGVSKPYLWQKNAHLALRVKEGAKATYRLYTGDKVQINGMERLRFDDKAALEQYPEKSKEFLTCRNFQFGAHYFPLA